MSVEPMDDMNINKRFPNELFYLIFKNITECKELLNYRLVCKRWKSIIEDSYTIMKNIEFRCKTPTKLFLLIKSSFSKNLYNLTSCDYITDEGIIAVAMHCKYLCNLNLTGADYITDEGIIAVAMHCKHLRNLNLTCKNTTDAGIIAVAMHCKNLQHLDLHYCSNITDAGIIAVAMHCKNLQYLNLYFCTHITDDGIIAVAIHCKNLQYLNIYCCTKITDKGILVVAMHCNNLCEMTTSRMSASCAEIVKSYRITLIQ
jgi:hypothetical protein